MTKDEVTVMNIENIQSLIKETQESGRFYDNIGVSIDYIDGNWIYGITIGGVLEQDFGSLTELSLGLQEFIKNNLD